MDTQDTILAALRAQRPELFTGPWRLTPLQENVYRFQAWAGSIFLKSISNGDAFGQNELRINQAWLPDPALHTPRLLWTLPLPGRTLAAWEWLEGEDLREAQREALTDAFAQIGRYHRAQRCEGPLTSPVTRRTYPSLNAALTAELGRLCAAFPDPIPQEEVLGRLSTGFLTRLHGDLHPGNLRLAEGEVYFTDWGYARLGLNWLELEYVRSVELESEAGDWWFIRPEEARLALPAYAEACGLDPRQAGSTHWAVMVWAELNSYSNATANHLEEGAARCRRNVARLLKLRNSIVQQVV